MILGTALGMCYIYSKKISHRDLKPDNILLDSQYYPKICDFGLSKLITSNGFSSNSIGTFNYLAPEVNYSSQKRYDGQKVDIFSFGMTIYSIMSLTNPYSGYQSQYEVTHAIINGIRPSLPKDKFTNSLSDFIEKCWSNNVNERPESFEKIVDDFLNWNILICDPNEIDLTRVNAFLEYCHEKPMKVMEENKRNSSKSRGYDRHSSGRIIIVISCITIIAFFGSFIFLKKKGGFRFPK